MALFDTTIITENDARNSFYFDKSSVGSHAKAKGGLEKLQNLTINT